MKKLLTYLFLYDFFSMWISKSCHMKKSMLGQKKILLIKYYMQQFFDKYVEQIIMIKELAN